LVHLHQDDLAVAERLARESIAAFADGDAYGAAGGQLYLGMILEGGGRTAETAACFTRARQAFAEIGSQALTIEATAGLARCALAGGDLSTATALAADVWAYPAAPRQRRPGQHHVGVPHLRGRLHRSRRHRPRRTRR
jgi:hypothetical protein